jgi:hypothetical protein
MVLQLGKFKGSLLFRLDHLWSLNVERGHLDPWCGFSPFLMAIVSTVAQCLRSSASEVSLLLPSCSSFGIQFQRLVPASLVQITWCPSYIRQARQSMNTLTVKVPYVTDWSSKCSHGVIESCALPSLWTIPCHLRVQSSPVHLPFLQVSRFQRAITPA